MDENCITRLCNGRLKQYVQSKYHLIMLISLIYQWAHSMLGKSNDLSIKYNRFMNE